MNKAIREIFIKASANAVDQGRSILKLKKLYHKSNPQRFLEAFWQCCLSLTKYDYKKNNNQVERCLKFAAAFCGNCYNLEELGEVDEFVVEIIDKMLLYHNSAQTNFRFFICKVIRLIIDQITARLRDDVCDRIQEAMFKRMNDHSSAVREQAVSAVMRLQRPEIPNCPVIMKYVEHILSEPNPTVRKVLVQKIAMTTRSLSSVYKNISSCDSAVRNAAYLRCASQQPCVFDIEQRQRLVVHIAHDDHAPNRSILERRLWPKWLDLTRAAAIKAASKATSASCITRNKPSQTTQSDNYIIPDPCISLLYMLRLDENVDQLEQTYMAYKVVLNVHFKINEINDLIKALRLDKKKLIPMEHLTLESAFYWKYLLKHVRTDKTLDEHSDEIVAELAGFCEYIDGYIKETFNKSHTEEFTWLPNQHTLLQLLEMISFCDLNDDFGRNKLKDLLMHILRNMKKIHEDVVKIIIRIFYKIEKKTGTVCEHICGIMTDIMRPYKITPLHDTIKQERDFKLAKLKFTLAIAEDSHTTAMGAKNYILAGELHAEVISLRDQINAVPNDAQLLDEHEKQQQMNGRREREKLTEDPKEHLRCCEILCVLITLCIRYEHTIPPILFAAKIEIIDVLLTSEYERPNEGLFAKALEIVTYYGLMDKDIAEVAMIPLTCPIISYRLIPKYHVQTLVAALWGFTYFLEKYGVDILQCNDSRENGDVPRSKQLSESINCSQIKRATCIEDVQRSMQTINLENISMEEYQSIILDMLDDKNSTVSVHAAMCITSLLKNNINVTSGIISKLLLKWFTPESYKINPKMLYILSVGISRFGETDVNSNKFGLLMEEATMCTLRTIIEAPADSSLYECDLPKCLQFLASITLIAEPNQSEIHRNLAQKIISLLSSNTIDIRSKDIYSKYLSYLDAPLFDPDSVRQFDELLGNIDTTAHKTMRVNIVKYVSKLRNIYNGNTTDTVAGSTISTSGADTRTAPTLILGPSDTNTQLTRISEANEITIPEDATFNRSISADAVCSTPIRSTAIIENTPIADAKQISYHISESDTDSQGTGIVDAPDRDVIISPNLERNSSDAEHSKENPLANQGPLRKSIVPNKYKRTKRLHNNDNEHYSEDSDSGSSHQHRSRFQPKRKFSLSLNIPRGANEIIHADTVSSDLANMQIQSSSSSQASTDSSSGRKRGRPSKLVRQNTMVQRIANAPKRFSKRLTSSSIEDDNRRDITVEADVHHIMSGTGTLGSDSSSTSSPKSCQQPQKKPRLLPRSNGDSINRMNGQTMTRGKHMNGVNARLRCIENDLDAIAIMTASSSSEQESEEFSRTRRKNRK